MHSGRVDGIFIVDPAAPDVMVRVLATDSKDVHVRRAALALLTEAGQEARLVVDDDEGGDPVGDDLVVIVDHYFANSVPLVDSAPPQGRALVRSGVYVPTGGVPAGCCFCLILRPPHRC